MLLATLGSSLLGNIFTGKGVVRACNGVVQEDKVFNSASFFQKLIGVYSRKNVAKISPNVVKHETYVVNLDKYKSIGAHWIALYGNGNNVTHFDSFGVDSILCGYFWIGFIDFVFRGKSLTDFTNLILPNNFQKSDKVILKYFGVKYNR